jgi:DNA repair exonuclease SbcCD ATPase subunit
MSEPKRYIFRIRECGCVKPEHLEGKYAPSALIIEETEERCGWVRYEDYARLKAEVERLTNQNALATPRHLIASQDIKTLREQIEELKLENSQYEEHHKYGQNVITSLREEVERLTKAGDSMAELMFIDKDYIGSPKQEAVVEWCKATEAKEGKPRA